jgi:7,8-dihydropterin-6-yl-methyl-4-(beta-D-ribofuranosyl)aminobenzene 5'-phosphate synthase
MEKCIRSILPGGDRVEIIIIDDGSKDNTGAIADEYAARYPDIIRVVHQPNGGHGEGINQGLRHATGKYFKTVDSDDWLSEDFPRFLDLLEDCDRKGGVDLFVTNYHYDHADGMGFFFDRNEHAPLYLSEACDQSCWSTKGGTADAHYIGIGEGLLERYRSRLVPASTTRVTTVAPGVHLVPHTTPGLEALVQRAGMLLRKGNALVPDGFAHEMSLVAELDEGACDLAVFCSCSHAGLPVIAHEVLAAFPSSHIAAFVGGLHLVHATDAEVKQVADAVLEYDIERLYTGHCTGNKAMGLLDECLTGRV